MKHPLSWWIAAPFIFGLATALWLVLIVGIVEALP
jgi:hypothetical protein